MKPRLAVCSIACNSLLMLLDTPILLGLNKGKKGVEGRLLRWSWIEKRSSGFRRGRELGDLRSRATPHLYTITTWRRTTYRLFRRLLKSTAVVEGSDWAI